jgi:hypothetical protein
MRAPLRLRFSQSLARRLHRPSHANVRSTIHRSGGQQVLLRDRNATTPAHCPVSQSSAFKHVEDPRQRFQVKLRIHPDASMRRRLPRSISISPFRAAGNCRIRRSSSQRQSAPAQNMAPHAQPSVPVAAR